MSVVLQRGGAALYGWAQPGETVTVTVDGVNAGTTVAVPSTGGVGFNASLQWSIKLLHPASAVGSPSSIVVSAASGSVTLGNVLFGDVWLCAGQSNMEFSVNSAFNASAEIAASGRYGAGLRFFTQLDTIADIPQTDGRPKSGCGVLVLGCQFREILMLHAHNHRARSRNQRKPGSAPGVHVAARSDI